MLTYRTSLRALVFHPPFQRRKRSMVIKVLEEGGFFFLTKLQRMSRHVSQKELISLNCWNEEEKFCDFFRFNKHLCNCYWSITTTKSYSASQQRQKSNIVLIVCAAFYSETPILNKSCCKICYTSEDRSLQFCDVVKYFLRIIQPQQLILQGFSFQGFVLANFKKFNL